MKRLLKNKKSLFKISKLKKVADWKDVNVYQNDIINIITDAMSQQSVIKVNYAGSGWRNILPYGWYTSKDNNVLLYCYKENSAIRSYRVDRIINLMIDDSLDTDFNNKEENKMEDFEILELPENNEEIMEISENEKGAETPFDESLEILEDSFNISNNEESFDQEENNDEENIQNNNISQEEINKMMSETSESDLDEQNF